MTEPHPGGTGDADEGGDTEASRAVVADAFMKPIVASLAINRQGHPSDLVGVCPFLLSDASAWMTGPVVNVVGGQVFRP